MQEKLLMIFNNIGRYFQLILLLLTYYTFNRLFFYFYNQSYFNELSAEDLMVILYNGLRFDLVAIVLLNIPIVIFHFIPFIQNLPVWKRIEAVMFVLFNSIGILANSADVVYYKFVFKRTTSEIFSFIGTGDDFIRLLPQFMKDFWFVFIIWLILSFSLIWVYRITVSKLKSISFKNKYHYLYVFIRYLFVLGFCILIIRGGFGKRPINIIHAAENVSSAYAPIVLNTPFTIIKTLGKENLKPLKYYDEKFCSKIYNPEYKPNIQHENKSKNVVIIICESLSKEYIGFFDKEKNNSFTPFLDSLMSYSRVYANMFANGKRSVEAIPAILAGIPTLMDTPFVTSAYASNQFNSIASLLSEKGYTSAFFHGGTNGTLGLDGFVKAAGFEKYYGRKEFNNDKYFDGKWGVYDDVFLQYAQQQISQQNQPFIDVVYTLSSHHPYLIPSKVKKKYPQGKLEIMQSIAYLDDALRNFFKSAQKEKWFKNTLFLITADHSAQADKSFYKTRLGMYSIPLVIFDPMQNKMVVENKIAQQIDIMPTVLGYLGYDKSCFTFGKNLLSEHSTFAISYLSGDYMMLKDGMVGIYSQEKPIAYFNIINDSLQEHNIINTFDEAFYKHKVFYKAFMQQYSNRMINNKIR